jgi:putative ABC transport system substrate-binding protein
MKIPRRDFIALLGSAAAISPSLWSLPLIAQQAQKVPQIGLLSGGSAISTKERLACFQDRLRQLGWVEGHSINIEYRFGEGDNARIPALAGELVRLNPDLIVTSGTPSSLAVQRATRDIPVVFNMVSDPVASGIVTNLARPDANVTGFSNFFPGMVGKMLQLIRTATGASRIAVLHDPTNPGKALDMRELLSSGKVLGVEVDDVPLRTAEDVDNAFAVMAKPPPHALIILVDGVTQINLQRIVDHAARLRLPAMYEDREFVEAGGLMSYALNFCQHFRRSATYVDKILKGAKPADLPVELPTTFEFVLNLKTAKTLGLALPPTLLALADEVIE